MLGGGGHPRRKDQAAISNRLRKSREAAGLTVVQVADALGKAEDVVATWEHYGTPPKIPVRYKLAVLYGVEMDDLFAELRP